MDVIHHVRRLSYAAGALVAVAMSPGSGSAAAAQDRTQQVLDDYGACVVRSQRPLASEFVLDRSTLKLEKKYRSLADGNCPFSASGSHFGEVELSLSGDAMRFALAEALLKDELATIDPAQLPNAALLRMPSLLAADYEPLIGREYSEDEFKRFDERRQAALTTLILYRFGECVVRTDPRAARELLRASPKSAEEGAAMQGLAPSLSACLEKGAQLKLNRPKLRALTAFSYYALAHAPVATADRGSSGP